eukprot:2170553-Rhodomonas_salina.2
MKSILRCNPLSDYGRCMRSPVLTKRMVLWAYEMTCTDIPCARSVLLAYACAVRCPVLTSCMVLPGCYASADPGPSRRGTLAELIVQAVQVALLVVSDVLVGISGTDFDDATTRRSGTTTRLPYRKSTRS